MSKYKNIGTLSYGYIEKTYGTEQWVARTFCQPPSPVVTPPPNTVAIVGSAGTSSPTISKYGKPYIAAFEIIREGFDKENETIYKKDRYVIEPKEGYCITFMEPKGPDHYIASSNPVLKIVNQK